MKKESHNKRSIFLVLFLCFIFPNLAGCGVNLFNAKPTPVIHSGWLKKWLGNPTCSPPCWENITPGITTMNEVKKLLPGIPEVTSFDVVAAGEQINWYFEGGGGGSARSGDTWETYGIVERLDFGFTPDTLRVGEVVGVYGEPNYIWTTPRTPPFFGPQSCYVEIIFEDEGILLELRPSPAIKKKSISITADSIVGVMTLDTKKDYAEYFSSLKGLEDYKLSPWKGYGVYLVK